MNPQPSPWIDLSHPITAETPPFPGDPAVVIEVLDSTDRPRTATEWHCNSSRMSICMHCGTHLDAPYHFYGDGITVERLSLDTCIGPATVIRLPELSRGGEITLDQLAPFETKLRATGRVIFDTGWHRRWKRPEYFRDHPVFPGETAQWLVDLGVKLVAVDFPSVDRHPYPAHLVFLGAGVILVENLTNLQAISAELVELFAVPLAVTGRDGSPVRALAREGNLKSGGL